jgi:heme-degrading monooxygenase HmoA
MVIVVLHYPALTVTVDELQTQKQEVVPFFEGIPGLIDKTWAMNESTGKGISVYHFEDRASADAWFNSERQREFRRVNGATIDFYDVGAVAVAVPLR